ncbi:MAG: hypothetical protein JWM47_4529 [Acidimicrobiales bacterium]|nr:hypothetical protein [Acidimicrobiales bacterium]
MSDTDEKDQKIADLEAKLEKAEQDVEKWKGLSRKHEDRAKENADAADELKKLKDDDKTESQKAADEATAAKARADKAEAAALRLEVALDKAPEGMPLAQVRKLAKRLSGTSKEELEQDADELFTDFKPDTGDEEENEEEREENPEEKGETTRRRPTERLRSGTVPGAKKEESNPEKLAEDVPRGW